MSSTRKGPVNEQNNKNDSRRDESHLGDNVSENSTGDILEGGSSTGASGNVTPLTDWEYI